MYDGVLLNGAVSVAGGAAFLMLVPRQLARDEGRTGEARALFFALVGMHLALAGFRQLVAFGALAPTEIAARLPVDAVTLDRTLFLVTTTAGAFTVAPLAFLACETRAPRWSLRVGFLVCALTALGLALFLVSDLRGPIPSRWGSEWETESILVRGILGAAVAIPAFLSVAALFFAPGGATRTFAFAALLYYAAIVPDAMGLTGVAFIVARIVAAGSSLVAWEAMRRPLLVETFLSKARTDAEP